MPIKIYTPKPANQVIHDKNEVLISGGNEDDGADLDDDGDILMEDGERKDYNNASSKARRKTARPINSARARKGLFTPGEIVTDDPQWMRWVLCGNDDASLSKLEI